ncbi:hypothetical protein HDU76_008043, partial [Blyttiomyces sp. JEL0837]
LYGSRTHWAVVDILENLAVTGLIAKEFDFTIKYCQEAISAALEGDTQSCQNLPKTFYNYAQASVALNDNDTALKMFLKCAEFGTSVYGENGNSLIGYAYLRAAQIEHGAKNYDEAKKWYQSAVDVMTVTGPMNEMDFYKALSRLGNLCFSDEEYDRAKPLLKAALNELLSHPEVSADSAIASLQSTIGDICKADGDFTEAATRYERSLEMYTEMDPQDQDELEIATLCLKLGKVHLVLDDKEKSHDYLTRALEIRQRVCGSSSTSDVFYRAEVTNVLGALALQNDDKENARKYFQLSVDGFASIENPSKSILQSYLTVLGNLAACLSGEEANEVAKIIDSVSQQVGDDADLFSAQYNLAANDLSEGRVDEAIQRYQKLVQQMSKTPTQSLADIFVKLGECYEEKDDDEKAKENYERAYETYLESSASFYEKGDLSGVFRCFKNALKVQVVDMNSVDLKQVAASNFRIADLFENAGMYAEARNFYQDELDTWVKFHGIRENDDVAISLSNLGGTATRMRDFEAAEKYYKETVAIRSNSKSIDLQEMGLNLKNLATVNRGMGRFDVAKEYYIKSLDAFIKGGKPRDYNEAVPPILGRMFDGDSKLGVQPSWYGVRCNACDEFCFSGNRYVCVDCEDYDVCEKCYSSGSNNQNHNPSHEFEKLEDPTALWADDCGVCDRVVLEGSAFIDEEKGVKVCMHCKKGYLDGGDGKTLQREE